MFILIFYLAILCILLYRLGNGRQIESFTLPLTYRQRMVNTSKDELKQLTDVHEETNHLLESNKQSTLNNIAIYNNEVCKNKKFFHVNNSNSDNFVFNDNMLHVKPYVVRGVAKSGVSGIITDIDKECEAPFLHYKDHMDCETAKQECLTNGLEKIYAYGGVPVFVDEEMMCRYDECAHVCESSSNDCWIFNGTDQFHLKPSFKDCKPFSLSNGECLVKPDMNLCMDDYYYYIDSNVINSNMYLKSLSVESNVYTCKYTAQHSNIFNNYDDILSICSNMPLQKHCYYQNNNRFDYVNHPLDILKCDYNIGTDCMVLDGDRLCYINDSSCSNFVSCDKENTFYKSVSEEYDENTGQFMRLHVDFIQKQYIRSNDSYLQCEYTNVPEDYKAYIDCSHSCYQETSLTPYMNYGYVDGSNTCIIDNCYSYDYASNAIYQKNLKQQEILDAAMEQRAIASNLLNEVNIAKKLAEDLEDQAINI